MSRDFRRRKRERPVKTTYLIVCEGSCEEIYFKNLKRAGKPKGTSSGIYKIIERISNTGD